MWICYIIWSGSKWIGSSIYGFAIVYGVVRSGKVVVFMDMLWYMKWFEVER